MLRQGRLCAIPVGFGTEIFAVAKLCVRNRMRSRQNACRLVVRSLLTTVRGPRQLCRASARRGACDSVRFSIEIFENFCGCKIFRSKSREIAPKSAPLDDAQPPGEPQRSPNMVPSVGTPRRVRFRAMCSAFRIENFENFSRPQNFSFEIA